MNEFQASLLLIGAVIVAGVFAYNKRQERQAARTATEIFKSRHADVLVGSTRYDDPESAELPAEAGVVKGGTLRSSVDINEAVADQEGSVVIDPRVDYVIELIPGHPIAASTVLECWSGMDGRFLRRASLSGLSDKKWEILNRGSAYDRLRGSLQMVSRNGVLGESEILAFRSEVETLASKLAIPVKAPEMRETLEAARALDSVCVEADIQIAFHIVATRGTGFSGTKLRAASESSGLVLDDLGRFRKNDELGRELFALSDRSGARFTTAMMKVVTPSALTLSMDVPRTPDTQHSFEAMVGFGRHLASLMEGSLVDDNDQPLEERSLTAIGAQLAVVSRALDGQGIVPGSPLALRLFS